jgi:hypothetical protein
MSTKLEFDAVARWMRVSRPQLGRMLKHPLAPRPTIETSQARWYRDEIAQWRAEYLGLPALTETPRQEVTS